MLVLVYWANTLTNQCLLSGEHKVPEFVLHVHVVDTELSTDLKMF